MYLKSRTAITYLFFLFPRVFFLRKLNCYHQGRFIFILNWRIVYAMLGDGMNGWDACFKGSFMLTQRRKRHRFEMGSSRIQFNIHIEQRERSKKKFAFAQCKWTLNVSASKSVSSVLTPHKLENDFDKEIINVSAGFNEAKTFMLYACIILQAVFFSIVYGLLPILESQYIYHFDFKILHWHLFRCCKRIISML